MSLIQLFITLFIPGPRDDSLTPPTRRAERPLMSFTGSKFWKTKEFILSDRISPSGRGSSEIFYLFIIYNSPTAPYTHYFLKIAGEWFQTKCASFVST